MLTTASVGAERFPGPMICSPTFRIPRQKRFSRYNNSTISLTSFPGSATSSSAQRSTRAWIFMARPSASDRNASVSRDQTKVSGEATALACERIDPGYGSDSETGSGIKETNASRNGLSSGLKHRGDPSSTRAPMIAGAVAAQIAESVPPSECPMTAGFEPCDPDGMTARAAVMASAHSAIPTLHVFSEAGSHSRR